MVGSGQGRHGERGESRPAEGQPARGPAGHLRPRVRLGRGRRSRRAGAPRLWQLAIPHRRAGAPPRPRRQRRAPGEDGRRGRRIFEKPKHPACGRAGARQVAGRGGRVVRPRPADGNWRPSGGFFSAIASGRHRRRRHRKADRGGLWRALLPHRHALERKGGQGGRRGDCCCAAAIGRDAEPKG